MKAYFPIKNIALAFSIGMAVSNAAEATINPGTIGPALGQFGSGSSGELFLSVWDQTAAISFSFDMGLTVEDFISGNPTPLVWDLGPSFGNFANTGHPLTFNIAGSNAYPGLITGGVPNANYGFLASHLLGFSLNSSPIANASLGQLASAFTGRIQFLNLAQLAQNPGATATDWGANLSEVTTSTSAGSYFNNFWGINEGKVPWTASAKVRQEGGLADTSLDMYFIHANPASIGSAAIVDPAASGFHFVLDSNNATLSLSLIPEPATAWLFVAGMVGLGLSIRRNSGSRLAP